MQETQETWIQSLGWEDLFAGVGNRATHPSILAWKIPWTEEPGGLHSMRSQRVGHTHTHTLTLTHSLSKVESGPNCLKDLCMADSATIQKLVPI